MSHKEAFFIASESCILLGMSPPGFWVPEPFLCNPTRSLTDNGKTVVSYALKQ